MKSVIQILIALLISNLTFAQSPIGGWKSSYTDDEGNKVRLIVIFSDGYQVATRYNALSGEFINTNGGSWKLDGNQMTEVVEFDSAKPDRVGTTVSFEINLSEENMSIVGNDMVLNRIDDGTPGDLQGAWLMSGRKRDGNIQNRDNTRPRKTMKILSGKRFQWIAYNTETKEFKGTGGGTYSTVNGKYTENIEFFSKDGSRVGAELEFNYELVDGKWHHSGFSSKGQPLYEIWSLRN